jgi:hypothetical protein
LSIRATPSQGSFDPLVAATPLHEVRATLAAERPTALSVFGTEMRVSGELRLSTFTIGPSIPSATLGRAYVNLSLERPLDWGRLALFIAGGAVGSTHTAQPQDWLYFGGPTSAPGYRFHELAALAGVTTRLEWRSQIPAPSVSLGRFGRIPGQATLAPFVQGTFIRHAPAGDVEHPTGGYPSVGVAVQPLFDMLRIQLARGLRHGRWSLNVDVSRDFWGIL